MAQVGNTSIVLKYDTELATLGSADGVVNLDTPIILPPNKPKYLKLIQTHFSKMIANVMNIATPFPWNNTTFRWSSNNGVAWTTVTLPAGRYDLTTFQDAIVAATYTLWTSAADPGIRVEPNLATGRVYCVLDSTKCNAPSILAIDFSSNTVSPNIAEWLGFSTAANGAAFFGNNVYSAPNQAMLNLIGDSVSVVIDGFGTLSNKDGHMSKELIDVPLITWSQFANEYVAPLFPAEQPLILLSNVPDRVTRFSVSFVGSRTRAGVSYPCVFMEGNAAISFQIIY